MTNTAFGMESTKPPNPANTLTIASRVLKQLFSNSHYKIIGSCAWRVNTMPPKVAITPAVEQFLPDLVITVSNNPKENPWLEARALYDNKASRAMYENAYKAATGFSLGFGNGSGQINPTHLNEDRTRIVAVIGSPGVFYHLPFVSHKAETGFGVPYYLSYADAVMDRTQIAELLYMSTHPALLMNHEIGSLTHTWGPEIPRIMRVTQPYNFRASVVAALHAADIVTNHNPLHVTKSTTNSCGKNCVVANAIYDPKNSKVIWQEIYPTNRTIHPGDPNDFGIEDDKKGNGNYVFVLWRKYRGCIQHKGKLIRLLTFPHVGRPEKR